ncbi:hypothetical protein ABTX24_29285, partial [Nocardioides sp. NPDC127514]|uniref:hypothetical protein n=1 Tax=Nocardioides sp. NPDC127514 TaxID=3154243 RepID=UPI003330113E
EGKKFSSSKKIVIYVRDLLSYGVTHNYRFDVRNYRLGRHIYRLGGGQPAQAPVSTVAVWERASRAISMTWSVVRA